MSTTLPPDDGFDADEPGVQSATIPETEIHDVLSNERRIILLRLLREEGTRDVGSLAEEIAGVQTDEWPPPRNKRQSVYVTLHQAHLPKLDDMGVVDYDSREKTVSLTRQASPLFEDETDDPVGSGVEPFFTLVVCGLLAAAASAGGVAPFSRLSVATYALGTLVSLLVGFAYRIGRSIAPTARYRFPGSKTHVSIRPTRNAAEATFGSRSRGPVMPPLKN